MLVFLVLVDITGLSGLVTFIRIHVTTESGSVHSPVMSMVYKRKQKSSRIDPWGTPWRNIDNVHVIPRIITFCFQSSWYEPNHFRVVPQNPNVIVSRTSRMLWSAVSNVALRSSSIRNLTCALSDGSQYQIYYIKKGFPGRMILPICSLVCGNSLFKSKYSFRPCVTNRSSSIGAEGRLEIWNRFFIVTWSVSFLKSVLLEQPLGRWVSFHWIATG